MKIMLSPGAIAPTRGSAGAAGYDLYANEYVTIGETEGEAKERAQIAEKYKRLAEDVKANEKYFMFRHDR